MTVFNSFLIFSVSNALTDYELSKFGCRSGKVYQFHAGSTAGGEKIGNWHQIPWDLLFFTYILDYPATKENNFIGCHPVGHKTSGRSDDVSCFKTEFQCDVAASREGYISKRFFTKII